MDVHFFLLFFFLLLANVGRVRRCCRFRAEGLPTDVFAIVCCCCCCCFCVCAFARLHAVCAWPLSGVAAVGRVRRCCRFCAVGLPTDVLAVFLLCSYVVRRATPRVPRYRERRNPRGRHFVTRVLRDRLPVCGVFAKVDLRSYSPFLRRSRSGEDDFGLAGLSLD